jgi:hypothetical protein
MLEMKMKNEMNENQYLLPNGTKTNSLYEWYDNWRAESPRFFKCELCGSILEEVPIYYDDDIAPFCDINGHSIFDWSDEEVERYYNCPVHGYLKAIHHPTGSHDPISWGSAKWEYRRNSNGKFEVHFLYYFDEVYIHCTEGCDWPSNKNVAPSIVRLGMTCPCGHKAESGTHTVSYNNGIKNGQKTYKF